MKAQLLQDGSLVLSNATETRVIRPGHEHYAALMRLYCERAAVQLSAAVSAAMQRHLPGETATK